MCRGEGGAARGRRAVLVQGFTVAGRRAANTVEHVADLTRARPSQRWNDYGDGHPLGGVYVGDRISDIAWKPNDQAIATVNASGGINVYTFKLRESAS